MAKESDLLLTKIQKRYMSIYSIYYERGAKKMRQVKNREDYLRLRNSAKQQDLVKRIRQGEENLKNRLVQMNYSCMPNPDGTLKGTTTISNTVGMDIDHIETQQMETIKDRILQKSEELGLLMLEKSARAKGYHLVFRRKAELSQEDNLRWASKLLGMPYDNGAKDITRVFYTTTASSEDLLFLSDDLFEISAPSETSDTAKASETAKVSETSVQSDAAESKFPTSYHGIPFTTILSKYWELNNHGHQPTKGDRDTLTYQLACDLRHICGKNFDWLDEVIPCYDGFPLEEKRQKIKSALNSDLEAFPLRLRNVLNALEGGQDSKMGEMKSCTKNGEGYDDYELLDEDEEGKTADVKQKVRDGNPLVSKKLPMGIKDSVNAVGPMMSMPILVAICPAIGALATGVRLDVHGDENGLNLHSYIVGDSASGKGKIDKVIEAWMAEIIEQDKIYLAKEAEWREKKRACKNKKDQPAEPKYPTRYVTLNNTVANIAERLAKTAGKHAYSYTPEADNVSQKWKSGISDYSVMIRESYDGARYDREAHSIDAVNVHIDHLLWNTTICGTPDALNRMFPNSTDGMQKRYAIAHTPDNTFEPLDSKPYKLTAAMAENIRQVAHLLMCLEGTIELPKLEERGRAWLEKIRLMAMRDDDRTMAGQRMRTCVTTQRMVCCMMLCKACELLIKEYGLEGAEKQLKQNPELWKEVIVKVQTPAILEFFDIIADYLMENSLYYFRERIEKAVNSPSYKSNEGYGRKNRGKNDSIYEQLDTVFTFEQAMQQAVIRKGTGVTQNSIHQMLKNWRAQHMIEKVEKNKFRKLT